jgi:hypothetical protein
MDKDIVLDLIYMYIYIYKVWGNCNEKDLKQYPYP